MRKLFLVLITLWGLIFTGCSSNGVTIYFGDKESPIKITNQAQTLSQALQSKGLNISEIKYKYQPSISWDSKLVGSSRIVLIEKPNVTLWINGKKKGTFRSAQPTVAKFLKEQKIKLSPLDKVRVSLNAKLKPNMVIRIDHIIKHTKKNKHSTEKDRATIAPLPKPGSFTSLFVQSTAYSYTGSRTATGKKPKRGTIAVDPRVIPLGTKLYIPGYGYGIAEDTGGRIKGHIIDVFFPSRKEALRWGRRSVKIRIIK